MVTTTGPTTHTRVDTTIRVRTRPTITRTSTAKRRAWTRPARLDTRPLRTTYHRRAVVAVNVTVATAARRPNATTAVTCTVTASRPARTATPTMTDRPRGRPTRRRLNTATIITMDTTTRLRNRRRPITTTVARTAVHGTREAALEPDRPL